MDINNNINDATNNIESEPSIMQGIPNTPNPVEETPTQNEVIDPKLASEEDIGEHDIVIEEDFQINLDVADVSPDFALNASPTPGTATSDSPPLELAEEQSGNITF